MVIAITVFIWIVLLIWAFRRPDRRWLSVRLVLTTLAVLALALAGLQPTHPVRAHPDSALLLTGRINRDTLDSLRNSLHPKFLFTLDSTIAKQMGELSLLPDLEYLLRHYPAVRQLHILGDGLTPQELELLRRFNVHFHLNDDLPAGIVELDYTSKVAEGGLITLRGVFNQTDHALRSLMLEGPTEQVMLLKEVSRGMHTFEASMPAQVAGRYLLSLTIAPKGGKEQQKEQLPLVITPAEKPRVLILNQAPSFETRFLKNWLAGQGYPVAVRSLISRGKWLTEFDNCQAVDLNTIRESTLTGFDVLVAEAATLAALEGAEMSAIEAAVRQGLGMCLLLGETLPTLSTPHHRFFLDLPRRPAAPACRIAGMEREVSKAPFILLEGSRIFPLLTDEKGQLLAAFRLNSQGRLAHSVMVDTYQILLEGKNKVYERLWTALLEGAARREESLMEWVLPEPPLAFQHYPVELTLIASEEQPAIQVHEPDSSRYRIPPSRHPFLEDQWAAALWPRQIGWHRLNTENLPQEDAWLFVQDTGAWQSLRISHKLNATRRWADQQQIKNFPEPAGSIMDIPYPLWWFYLLFLACAALLWLEERW